MNRRIRASGPSWTSSGAPGRRHASKGVANHLASWIRAQGFQDPRKSPNHALRHWWKTKAGDLGIQERTADAIQGHAPRSVAATYDHASLKRLADAERRTSNQILVAIYPRLPEGVALEEYTLKAFRAWGVGQAGKDNGIVLFIILDGGDGHGVDWLEVGRGLEGAVPDATAKWLLAEVLNPDLKRKAYELGMRSIVNQLLQLTAYEFSGDGRTQAERRARKADEDEDAEAWLDKTFEGMLGVLWPMAWLMILGVLAWKVLPWVLSGGEPGRLRRGGGSRGSGGFWSGALLGALLSDDGNKGSDSKGSSGAAGSGSGGGSPSNGSRSGFDGGRRRGQRRVLAFRGGRVLSVDFCPNFSSLVSAMAEEATFY